MIATIVRIVTAGALAAVTVAGPATATETAVVARGMCSGESHWRLALATDGAKIWAGYKVDAPVPGEVWRVRITHNGYTVFAGRRVATEPDGIFGVRLSMRNLDGPDVVRARSLNTVTGEVCHGRAVI
jgi:hypothetical protein